MTDVGKAAAYSARHLKKLGHDRSWLFNFWRAHVEDQRAAPNPYADPSFVDMVVDVQRFIYGDEGDVAMGVATQAATAAETDGKLGPGTSRRMQVWLDWLEEDDAPIPVPLTTSDDCILVNGERLPVGGGVQIESLDETDAYSLGRYSNAWGKRSPTMLSFGHWDVCTSVASCLRVLKQRGLSSGGGFDNPGADGRSVFYQSLDPAKRRGKHGGRNANRAAFFSYDLSNAVSKKYAQRYLKKVGIARPTLHMDKRWRLGRGSVFLGMYAGQIHSLLYILRALADYTGLSLRFPVRVDGTPLGRNWKRLWASGYDGCATHLHLPGTSKWDVRGLEFQIVVMFLKGRLPMGEFPSLVESFRLHDAHWAAFLDEFERTCRWPELGIGV